ncbi:MAG: ABC transporter ATP-binding protein [Candidatus Gracilibacteria bacterium]|nr:ABC transporter ATP-binding protein [Candidatus Gracilibacteria bacterium]
MKESKIQYTTLDLIRDLGSFVKPYRKKFLLGTVIRLVSDIVWLYPAVAVGLMIDHLTESPQYDQQYISVILVLWAVASLLHYLGRDTAKYFIYYVAEQSGLDASYKTLKHLISLDLSWQEKENSGNKMKRIMHGYEGFNRLIRIFVDLVCESSVNAVFVLLILATFDPVIAGGMFLYMMTYYIISLFFLRKAKDQAYVVNKEEEHVQGQFYQIINNINTVKWLGLDRTLLPRFKGILTQLLSEIRKRILYFRRRAGVLGIYNDIFRISLLFYIIVGISNGDFKVGILAIFFSYFTKIQNAADELAMVTAEFIIQKIRIRRMMGILKQVPTVELTGGKNFPIRWKQLEIKNLSFAYNTRKYINRLDLTIKRGEKIGIVGLSGAGKTTLFKLLLSLYENYEGQILFDKTPLSEIKRSSYLEHTAVVLQETEVFNFSLADNISLAGKKKNEKQLEKAMEVAHIKEFLHKLPEGDNTLIGEKGVKLSGGEKQRVGIARAVYKNPQILFMDEATSHLDIDSEQMIQDSLKKFLSGITAVVIAHRLSTIKEMDRIVVMKEGRISEQGSFQYLMQKKGEFYRLWNKQIKKA